MVRTARFVMVRRLVKHEIKPFQDHVLLLYRHWISNRWVWFQSVKCIQLYTKDTRRHEETWRRQTGNNTKAWYPQNWQWKCPKSKTRQVHFMNLACLVLIQSVLKTGNGNSQIQSKTSQFLEFSLYSINREHSKRAKVSWYILRRLEVDHHFA